MSEQTYIFRAYNSAKDFKNFNWYYEKTFTCIEKLGEFIQEHFRKEYPKYKFYISEYVVVNHNDVLCTSDIVVWHGLIARFGSLIGFYKDGDEIRFADAIERKKYLKFNK